MATTTDHERCSSCRGKLRYVDTEQDGTASYICERCGDEWSYPVERRRQTPAPPMAAEVILEIADLIDQGCAGPLQALWLRNIVAHHLVRDAAHLDRRTQ